MTKQTLPELHIVEHTDADGGFDMKNTALWQRHMVLGEYKKAVALAEGALSGGNGKDSDRWV